MRAKVVLALLVLLLAGLALLVVTRERTPYVRPVADAGADAAPADAQPTADAAAPIEAATPPPPAGDDAAVATASDASDAQAVEAGPPLGRPLRVAALGWEVAAPGLVAGTGDLQVRAVDALPDLEKLLARGGADAEGADVAVLPLPSLVAAYERLRALDPRVFAVLGWSRGREGLFAAKDASLLKPRADEVRLSSKGSEAAVALALFALDAAGTPPSKVRLAAEPKGAQFLAASRPFPADLPPEAPSKLLLTTADASALVPLVAIAPQGLVQSTPLALEQFARGWAAGIAKLRKDVPAAAREVANEKGAPGPADLLERLGQLELVPPSEGARALSASPKDPTAVGSLFMRFWSLMREVGLLTSPAPASAPLVGGAGGTDAGAPGPVAASEGPAANARPILVARRTEAKPDEAQVAADAVLLARVFERATVRVSAKAPATAKAVVAAAGDSAGSRIVAGAAAPDGAATVLIEVLAPP